jgi:hypothetical protein
MRLEVVDYELAQSRSKPRDHTIALMELPPPRT